MKLFKLFGVVLGILTILVLTYWLVLSPRPIDGLSMAPTLPHDSVAFFLKPFKRLYRLQRGDVVIFRRPDIADTRDRVSRVIALPGEKIQFMNGKVFINNNVLEERYLYDGVETNPFSFGFSSENNFVEGYIIPVGNYFLMNDVRDKATDSREWGPIPLENIVSVSVARFLPDSFFSRFIKTINNLMSPPIIIKG